MYGQSYSGHGGNQSGSSESVLAYRAAYREHWEERIRQWACSPSTQQGLEEFGFSILPGAFNAGDVDMLLHELPWHLEGGAVKMEQQNKGNGGYVLSCKGSS